MRRARSRTASRARLRTSSATRASCTKHVRSSRSRSGRAAPGGESRPGSRSRSQARSISVRYAHVERLDSLRRAEVTRELRMEAGPWEVALVCVGRHLRAEALEEGAVTHRTAADADRAEWKLELAGSEDARLALQDEDLPPSRIDDGNRAGSACSERVERRNPGDRDVQRERETARRRQPDANAGKAPGADPDRQRLDVRRARARLPEQRIDVLQQRH